MVNPTKSTDDRPLSLTQAAAIAGVSERTLARRIAASILPSSRIGRHRVVGSADLRVFMEDKKISEI